jgi:hypothetical protein
MIAEESTAWPMVSRPTDVGGLGFGLKWNMGWMHDTLQYMKQDPVYRKYHHGQLTFSLIYAFNENFVLPLSHDEVVYGKGSLIGKMPGDDWQMFANLRTLYGYMWAHPGKKLLFMGGEFGQRREWTHEGELEWWVAGLPEHAGVKRLMSDLNRVYVREPALHQLDFSADGFEWVDVNNGERACWRSCASPRAAARRSWWCAISRRCRAAITGRRARARHLARDHQHRCRDYGGSGWGNLGGVESVPVGAHGRVESINLNCRRCRPSCCAGSPWLRPRRNAVAAGESATPESPAGRALYPESARRDRIRAGSRGPRACGDRCRTAVIDGGRFPVKSIAGRPFAVTAHCFADGHDKLRVILQWQPVDAPASQLCRKWRCRRSRTMCGRRIHTAGSRAAIDTRCWRGWITSKPGAASSKGAKIEPISAWHCSSARTHRGSRGPGRRQRCRSFSRSGRRSCAARRRRCGGPATDGLAQGAGAGSGAGRHRGALSRTGPWP